MVDQHITHLGLVQGVALLRLKRYRDALAALDNSAFGVTPYWKAQAHWYLGEKEEARSCYEEGTKLSPDEEMEALRVETAALLGIK